MGINNLYLQPGYVNSTSSSIEFDSDVVKAAMKRIYEKKYDTLTEIDEELFDQFWDIYNNATDKGFGVREETDADFDFYQELRYNNGVFAAFKTHRLQNDMAAQLLDENGKLKTFQQWEQDTVSIRDHHVRRWLETEYNTAVKRAHLAADWRQFEREKDVLPNLEWMPSTAVEPDEIHKKLWGTILPVDDPFWNEYRPGDRWGCKCGLRNTDKKIKKPPKGYRKIPKPAPGLDNNPGKDAMLYSFSHPYFALGYLAYKKLAPIVKRFVKKQIKSRAEQKQYSRDKVAGKKLLIHKEAHQDELKDNICTARVVLDSFPKLKIRIREHVYETGTKNPEYEVNGMIADAKRVKSPKGIADAFVKAKEQKCEVIIIDLDKHLKGKDVNRIDVAKRIGWRREDFEKDIVKECYIVHNEKVIRITKKEYDNRKWIIEQLKKSGM